MVADPSEPGAYYFSKESRGKKIGKNGKFDDDTPRTCNRCNSIDHFMKDCPIAEKESKAAKLHAAEVLEHHTLAQNMQTFANVVANNNVSVPAANATQQTLLGSLNGSSQTPASLEKSIMAALASLMKRQ